jgi:hypothetical protein
MNDYCFELIMHNEHNYYYFFPLFSLSEHLCEINIDGIMHKKHENNFGNIKVCRITLEGGQDNNSPLSSLMPSCSRVNHVWLGHLFRCPLNTSFCFITLLS